jgi:hypothetical protein
MERHPIPVLDNEEREMSTGLDRLPSIVNVPRGEED